MSNYNLQLQSNNIDLQEVLEILQTKKSGGEQATPVISVNTSGLVTATAGTKSSTYQLAFQAAKTITPSATSQVAVSSGYYTGGNVTVAAVPTQSKSVTPTSATQNVTPDSGKFLSKVTVNAIPNTYVKPSYTKAATTYTPSTTNQTISAGTYLTGIQTIKGDSNLVASNIKNGVSIFGVSGTLTAGTGGGDGSENEDAIISKSISGAYTNNRVTTIGSYAFIYCASLTTASFPVATSIGSNAFYGCDRLTTVSFPTVTFIGSAAFYSCSSLTTASFPKVTTIRSSVFYDCASLTTASFPVATSIGSGAFCGCDRLTTVSFPKVTTIERGAFQYCSSLTTASFPVATSTGNQTFQNCKSLTTASFPKATSIGSYAFNVCSKLTTVSFPVATTIGSYAFQSCTSLTTASFPAATSIGNYTFAYCTSLTSLYLTGSSRCSLVNSNAFSSAGITSSTGSIYVPASLLTSYQTATNWAYFSTRFVAFDGAGGDSGGSLITFTIDDIEYQAEEGMTWAEWCDTEYNTSGYYEDPLYSNIRRKDSLGHYDIEILDQENSLRDVAANELILSNMEYTTSFLPDSSYGSQ